MVSKDMGDLLDTLQRNAGCAYISDLHNADNAGKVRQAVISIAADEYSLQTWNDAIRYITITEETFGNANQAREYLIGRLTR